MKVYFLVLQIAEAVTEPQNQHLERPDMCPREYYAVMTKCWEPDPDRRPTFNQLVLTLPQVNIFFIIFL